jgi:chromosome partitioning protein
MKIISVYNFKGGTGKTSICFLIGQYLSQNGKKVLLIDADPQASLTKSFPEMESKTIFDFLSETAEAENCIIEVQQNLSLMPGSFRVLKVQSNILNSFMSDNLKKLKYDFCIIDNSPTMNNLIISCIQASSLVLVPALISKYDLNESGFIVSNIRQISPKTKVKLLLNRTQKVNDFTKMEIEYKEALSESGQVIDFSIPNTNLIRKYIDFGQNPFIGKSKAKEAFKEIIKRLVSEL